MAEKIGLWFISIVVAVIATWLGTHLFFSRQEKRKEQPLRRILNFGNDDLLFVFPPRDEVPEAVLPQMSTEDFLAINNIITALIKINWKRKIGVRNPSLVTDADRKRNLVTICSSKSNSFTKEIINAVREKGCEIPCFEQVPGNGEWVIRHKEGTYSSKSYEQIREYKAQGKKVAEQEIDDVALVAKVTNPWKETNKILIVAGIRGIGTWGAAECVKKGWNKIYDRKSNSQGFKKNGDFATIMAVKYNNCDIHDPQKPDPFWDYS